MNHSTKGKENVDFASVIIIQGTDGVRDEGMLDSAISQPLQTFDNMELYPGIVDKAVRLGYGLITNHPFVDGNKRIGTHTLLVTLDINGIELQYQDEDLIQLILNIASGKADDRVLRTWVLAHIV